MKVTPQEGDIKVRLRSANHTLPRRVVVYQWYPMLGWVPVHHKAVPRGVTSNKNGLEEIKAQAIAEWELGR